MKNVILRGTGKETRLFIDGVEITDVLNVEIKKDGGTPTVLKLEAFIKGDVQVET